MQLNLKSRLATQKKATKEKRNRRKEARDREENGALILRRTN